MRYRERRLLPGKPFPAARHTVASTRCDHAVRALLITAAAMLLNGGAHAATACIQNPDGTYDTLLSGQQEPAYPPMAQTGRRCSAPLRRDIIPPRVGTVAALVPSARPATRQSTRAVSMARCAAWRRTEFLRQGAWHEISEVR